MLGKYQKKKKKITKAKKNPKTKNKTKQKTLKKVKYMGFLFCCCT